MIGSVAGKGMTAYGHGSGKASGKESSWSAGAQMGRGRAG